MTETQAYRRFDPTIQRLDNGLTVAMECIPYVHSASVGIWVKTGSANERIEQAGISHFLEHLFFKGTETRTARELMEAVESRGGQMNAFTSREYTCLYVRSLSEHVSAGIEILADILKNSTFCDLEKERNVILEEIASSIDVPEEYAHDLLSQRAWPGKAVGRPIAGWHDSVSSITLDNIRSYKEAWYRPDNLYVSIAGKFDEGAVLEQVEREFGSLKGALSEELEVQDGFSGGIETVERDIAQNHVAFGFPGPAITDPRRYAYDLLSSVLGGGSTSRLFERIRENEGLAYSIYSFHSGYRDTGMLGVYAAIAPENLERVLEISFEELGKLQKNPLPSEELHSNAEQLKGGLLLSLEGTFSRMARMVRSLMYFDRVIPIDEILASVDAVTVEDIGSLAKEVFKKEQCAMTILGPSSTHAMAIGL